LKYHNNPIHIIATITCTNLHKELQKKVSKTNPPFKKNNNKNNKIVSAIDECIVFDKDENILNINKNYISKNKFL
tara:strand:+ start:592 stop:816 length:225 start_codon:yes stop_codon:yes gene_type:complete